MYRLVKPYVNVTRIKHSCCPGSNTHLLSENSPSNHKAVKDNQINTFLEKMPKENTFKTPSKIV